MDHVSTLSLSLTDSTAVSMSNGFSSASLSKQTTLERNNSVWDRFKGIIERLYITEDKTLEETMEDVSRITGFNASSRKWKMKLKEWGFEKNFTSKEVAWMVDKTKQRLHEQQKPTDFFRQGVKVSQKKIKSFKKRKIRHAVDMEQVGTPPGMTYGTPRPDDSDSNVPTLVDECEHDRSVGPNADSDMEPYPTPAETGCRSNPEDDPETLRNQDSESDLEALPTDAAIIELTNMASLDKNHDPEVLPSYPGLYPTVPTGGEDGLHDSMAPHLDGHEDLSRYYLEYLQQTGSAIQSSEAIEQFDDFQFNELLGDHRDDNLLQNPIHQFASMDVLMSGTKLLDERDALDAHNIPLSTGLHQPQIIPAFSGSSALNHQQFREMWTDEPLLDLEIETENLYISSPVIQPFFNQPFFDPIILDTTLIPERLLFEPPYEVTRERLKHLLGSFYPSRRDLDRTEWNQCMATICSLLREKGTDQRHMSTIFQEAFASTTNYLGLSKSDPEVLAMWREPIWKGFLRFSTSTWLPNAEIVCERFIHSFPRSGDKIDRWKCRLELSKALSRAGFQEKSQDQLVLAFYDCLHQRKTLPGRDNSNMWQELLAGCGPNSQFAYFVVYEAAQCFRTDQWLWTKGTDIMRAMRPELENTDYSHCPKEWVILYLHLFEYNYGTNRVHLPGTPLLPEAAWNISRAIEITNRFCIDPNAKIPERLQTKHGWQRRWIKLSNPRYHHEGLGRATLQQIKEINERLGNPHCHGWRELKNKNDTHAGEHEMASARRHPQVVGRGRKRSRQSSIRTDQRSNLSSTRFGHTYTESLVSTCPSVNYSALFP